MAINRERMGAEYPVPDLEVTAERIAAYADATGDQLPAYRWDGAVAPPVFAIVPAWPAVAAVLADESTGIEVGRTVHGEQRMRLHRPIRAGDLLRSVGRLVSVEERGANEVFVIALATTDGDGKPVADQEVVVVSRGTAAGVAPAARPAAAPKPARKPAPEPPPPDLERTVELDPNITFEYSAAAGDDNRIHVDDEFARSVGLPGIIVQGLCLLSISLQPVVELAGGPERIREVAVRFAAPIRPGQAFTTRVWRQAAWFAFDGLGPDGDVLRNGRVTLAD
ncbi:MAG: MaoC/PaaZ C-terminal domain-containing protein [Actinomycetota bacterium]